MSAVAPMSDAALERQIRKARHRMEQATDRDVRLAAAKEMADLIAARSPGQVERMERARGLR